MRRRPVVAANAARRSAAVGQAGAQPVEVGVVGHVDQHRVGTRPAQDPAVRERAPVRPQVGVLGPGAGELVDRHPVAVSVDGDRVPEHAPAAGRGVEALGEERVDEERALRDADQRPARVAARQEAPEVADDHLPDALGGHGDVGARCPSATGCAHSASRSERRKLDTELLYVALAGGPLAAPSRVQRAQEHGVAAVLRLYQQRPHARAARRADQLVLRPRSAARRRRGRARPRRRRPPHARRRRRARSRRRATGDRSGRARRSGTRPPRRARRRGARRRWRGASRTAAPAKNRTRRETL